jgi:hypothetical protein
MRRNPMAHLVEKLEGEKAVRKAAELCAVQPAETVTRAELWGSSFSDPGPDWSEWRFFDAQGVEITRSWRAGY